MGGRAVRGAAGGGVGGGGAGVSGLPAPVVCSPLFFFCVACREPPHERRQAARCGTHWVRLAYDGVSASAHV